MSLSLEMLRTLFNYSVWARDQIIASAMPLSSEQLRHEPEGGAYGSIFDTLAHMATSQWIWFERIRDHTPKEVPGGADFIDLAALHAWWTKVHDENMAYFDTLQEDDLLRTVTYVNHRDGQTYSRIIWHALLQTTNHQTEHRAQVAAMLSALGIQPPMTDLVVFLKPDRT